MYFGCGQQLKKYQPENGRNFHLVKECLAPIRRRPRLNAKSIRPSFKINAVDVKLRKYGSFRMPLKICYTLKYKSLARFCKSLITFSNRVFSHKKQFFALRLLFSLKPKEVAKMRLLAIWIDQR